MCNAYQKRLICATCISLFVIICFYGILLRGSNNESSSKSQALRTNDVQSISSTSSTSTSSSSTIDDEDDDKEKAGTTVVSSSSSEELIKKQEESCPRMKGIHDMEGRKPIWVAGYPGSGFDLVAPIISYMTGFTVVDVYRNHGCSGRVKEGAAVSGVCMTHYPVIHKDSPRDIAIKGEFYHADAMFIIRNPANAIRSYYTRWYGAQQHKFGSHIQPPQIEWITWRNNKLIKHIQLWVDTLEVWYNGIPEAGINGISLYIPYETLVHNSTGPELTKQIGNELIRGQKHNVANNPHCYWYKIMNHTLYNRPLDYEWSYNVAQKHYILEILNKLIVKYESKDTELIKLLQYYYNDINKNLILDDDIGIKPTSTTSSSSSSSTTTTSENTYSGGTTTTSTSSYSSTNTGTGSSTTTTSGGGISKLGSSNYDDTTAETIPGSYGMVKSSSGSTTTSSSTTTISKLGANDDDDEDDYDGSTTTNSLYGSTTSSATVSKLGSNYDEDEDDEQNNNINDFGEMFDEDNNDNNLDYDNDDEGY